MGIEIKIDPKMFNFEVDVDPILKEAVKRAKAEMEATPGLPEKRVNYKGSFFVSSSKKSGEKVYYVKNRKKWMDAMINNGHVVYNSKNGVVVSGTNHYNKGQAVADSYVRNATYKLKKK